MQKLQLYIEGTRIDLFKDESVSMTQSIQNVKDLSKIFTEFTQSFTIPASKSNNKIFKHYYNFDISGGFDARNKVSASIELNDIPFKSGYIKLEGVEMKKDKAYAYKITFFGKTVNLKDILGDDQISSLSSLNANNLDYDYGTVFSKLYNGNPATDVIITPLITHTRQLYYNTSTTGEGNLYKPPSGYLTSTNGVWWSDLKYAHRLYEIITAIQSEYSLTFSDDFFNDVTNQDFYGLFMWLHRKKGDVEPAQQVAFSYQQVSEFEDTSSPTLTQVNGAIIISTDQYFWPNYISANELKLTPVTSDIYRVRVFRNGSLFYQSADLTGATVLTASHLGLLGVGNYTVSIASETILGTFFAAGNIEWDIEGYDGGVLWTDNWVSTSAQASASTFECVITEQLPKIKIIDFLAGLFKTFNLTAYVNEVGTIVVQSLDDYYAASSVVWTIDNYVDIKKGTVDVALPFREVTFSYEILGTFLAQ